ncbi:hypothetical protein Scep_004893 [Stephania cephalantha]|uniref:Uncharacterized protein n=1 Tax=Stephania cephalantha TaxID=152367 RepID=A0AAP0PXP8_9MAGN
MFASSNFLFATNPQLLPPPLQMPSTYFKHAWDLNLLVPPPSLIYDLHNIVLSKLGILGPKQVISLMLWTLGDLQHDWRMI